MIPRLNMGIVLSLLALFRKGQQKKKEYVSSTSYVSALCQLFCVSLFTESLRQSCEVTVSIPIVQMGMRQAQ